eukprot:5050220-Pyramimonas_sp.AAC.1
MDLRGRRRLSRLAGQGRTKKGMARVTRRALRLCRRATKITLNDQINRLQGVRGDRGPQMVEVA